MKNYWLNQICAALGWQGGTIHQVIGEIKRLQAALVPPRTIGEVVISTSLTGESGFQMIKWAADAPPIKVGMKVYAEQADDVHPDDQAVDFFAQALKAKLAAKRAEGRKGWEDASVEYLQEQLFRHVYKGDPVDVGNFAMMLFCRDARTQYVEQWVFDLTGKWPGVGAASSEGSKTS
ncbi:hypothetical protein [Variovorax sp. 3P27G3]|jgi:hypothetical protein|uniref:hypothetical protein n=1 Tax=Variovorax sp. 3P27G3 TaxID=2502214 RepID=UPI0010F4A30E|nr:hypothetical protein [Variovorax sp. 3P27G3]